jgi:type IV pilus assembly protein PilA
MKRIIKSAQKGFTLIELMIVVAIIGILAAVAIPQFLDMMKKSKRNEAEVQLDSIRKAEKAGWAERAGFVVGTGDPLPSTGDAALGCCDGGGKNRKCAVTSGEWDDGAAWEELDFEIDEEGYFVYAYEGTSDDFTATAVGDLDCDGQEVTYTLTGERNANGNPEFLLDKPINVD